MILRPPVPFLRQPEPSCRHSLLLAAAIADVRSIVAEGGVFLVGGDDENKTIACNDGTLISIGAFRDPASCHNSRTVGFGVRLWCGAGGTT